MAFDALGNIAIVHFPEKTKKSEKIKEARNILKNPNIKTVLEKKDKVHGRLRTINTIHLLGIKTKEAIHKESGCFFKLDVEKCYFSPRLSGERLEVAEKIKKEDRVLVLFAGVAPYPIIVAKKTGALVTSVELGRECYKYAMENVRLNKLNNVEIIQGDVKKLDGLLKKNLKYDVIIMARPQLKDTFLKYTWKFCKKGTRIYYYDFGRSIEEIINKVMEEAKKAKVKIKIINFKKAGDIAPYKFRWRVDIIVN